MDAAQNAPRHRHASARLQAALNASFPVSGGEPAKPAESRADDITLASVLGGGDGDGNQGGGAFV
jgi:hypothetical protein